jgi:hypothetical protein
MQTVILAGGLGTRLAEETGLRPKPMAFRHEGFWHPMDTLRAGVGRHVRPPRRHRAVREHLRGRGPELRSPHPGTVRSLLRGEVPLIRSNGKLVRDYIYVDDVVDAYLTLADAAARADVKHQAFNFSTGTPLSVLDVVERLQRAVGTSLPPRILNEHSYDWSLKHR